MSGVDIQSFNAFGGGAPFLNRFNTPFSSLSQVIDDYVYIGSIGRDLSVAGGVLTFGASPAGNELQVFTPNTIAVGNRDQYVQMRYAANGGTAANPTRPCWFVFSKGQNDQHVSDVNFSGYTFIVRNEPANNDALLLKTGGTWVTGGIATLATLATVAIPAIGDDVRVEARRVNGGVDTQITIKYNGTVITTVTDAPGFVRGVPGFGSRGNNSNVTTFGFSLPDIGQLR